MSHSFKVGDRVVRLDSPSGPINVGAVGTVVVSKYPDKVDVRWDDYPENALGNYPERLALVGSATIPCEPSAIDEVPAGSPVEAFAKLRAENERLRAELNAAGNDERGHYDALMREQAELEADRDFWRRECGRTPAGKRLIEARERTAALKERG